MAYRVAELANRLELDLSGDGDTLVTGVCGLSDDRADHIAFVTRADQLEMAAASSIPVFVTTRALTVPSKVNLFHDNPEHMMACIAELFIPSQLGNFSGVHDSAIVAGSARVGSEVAIGANVVIGEQVEIGPRARIYPNVVIMDRCRIGADCVVYPNCTLREDSELGERVILQPGVTIGGDGYGYVKVGERHIKIPQLGRVVLEDDVEVGANSTIDRARFSETRVGRGTKIDNLVMLGHNVVTGEDCLLVSQVGISGSTRLGDRVVLAGQVGSVGHVSVADDVTVLGKGGITKDIPQAGVYAGMPLKPARLWRRAMARLYAGLR